MAQSVLVTYHQQSCELRWWTFDPARTDRAFRREKSEFLRESHGLEEGYELIRVAGYWLFYKPTSDDGYLDYILVDGFTPYPSPLGEVKQTGFWYWDKFAGSYSFDDVVPGPNGQGWSEEAVQTVRLTGATGYVLSQIATRGRRTFSLFSLDAYPDQPGRSIDPISQSMGDSGAFPTIGGSDVLIPITNYVLVVSPDTNAWRVFSFDPQLPNPLSDPMLHAGQIPTEYAGDTFVALGDQLVALKDGKEVAVFDFTPSDPFANAQRHAWPEELDLDGTSVLGGYVQDPVATGAEPGTLDFMREKVQHVVYYVLESRSFDSVVGWLYDENTQAGIHWIGGDGENHFDGASTANSNTSGSVTVQQGQVLDGAVGPDLKLDKPVFDPFHGTPDSIHQQWSGGYAAYQAGQAADMGGFLDNAGNGEVMLGYVPAQLPVLSGLATGFAISDRWFCGEAGGTTANRATIGTGSALDITVSYEGGEAYATFSERPRRQSVWKLLSNFGITDWVIYYSVLWEDEPYTYHLWVQGQLPSVDQYPGAYSQPVQSFFDAVSSGDLPRFSFLEPVWYDPSGTFTSYHPTGDVIPGEVALKQIYDAIQNSSEYRDNTVLVVSFSKGGGMYDHVPAQRLAQAWANDRDDGYRFDVSGTRVPTLVISPYVAEKTVFRSTTDVPYDHTSLMATLLSWLDIPKPAWGLGERMANAPTFESVLSLGSPRTSLPQVERAVDANYPMGATVPVAAPAPLDGTWKGGSEGLFNLVSNWEVGDADTLPTATATFATAGIAKIQFSLAQTVSLDALSFTSGAGPYTFQLDEEQPLTPQLVLIGAGVVNSSGVEQIFAVEASSTATDQVQLQFLNSASAGQQVTYLVGPTTPTSQAGGIVAFGQRATAGSSRFEVRVGSRPPVGYATVGAEVRFQDASDAGTASFQVYGTTGPDSDTFGNVVFHNRASANQASFQNVGGLLIDGTVYGDGGNTQFYEQSTADHATIVNLGGTGGNGGDTAFDGTATAGNATITNHAAAAGYGGVTSFNNNSPYMSSFAGATAGEASIENLGASQGQEGSGGHTEFTGAYGSGRGGSARIVNRGASYAGQSSSGGGYTLFAVNGKAPWGRPTADHATLENHPATAVGAGAGNTRFTLQHWGSDAYDADMAGPYGGHASITNFGSGLAGAAAGYTTFDHQASADSATIVCQPGDTSGCEGGWVRFSDKATAGSASLVANGTGGGLPGRIVFEGEASGDRAEVTLNSGVLDVSAKTGDLSIQSLQILNATIASTLQGAVAVSGTVSMSGSLYFDFTGAALPTGSVTLITAPSLSGLDIGAVSGSAVGGRAPQFTIVGGALQVSFG